MNLLTRPFAIIRALCFLVGAATALGQSGWTVGRTNIPGVTSADGIAFGNGRFVVTLTGSGEPSAAWSTDGLTWQASSLRYFDQASILFTRGAFYAASGTTVKRSVDGDAWETVHSGPADNSYRGLASNGTSILVGSAMRNVVTLLYSADGTTWTASDPLPQTGQAGTFTSINEVVYGGGRYFVSYFIQNADNSLTPLVASTADGRTWSLVPEFSGGRQMSAGSGRAVIIGSGKLHWTADAVTYGAIPLPYTVANSGKLLYAGGRFFGANTLIASNDLTNWSLLASTADVPTNLTATGIAFGNGRYVAVGWVWSPSRADVVATLVVPAPPVITSQPSSQKLGEGESANLEASVLNPDLQTTFQWRRDGLAIAGATSTTHRIASVTRADSGRYTLEVRNALGSTLSEGAVVAVYPPSETGRLANLSVLTTLDAPDANLILGFVASGGHAGASKPVLVRAAGPSLARFGVAEPVPDPKLELYAGSDKVSENDNWGGATTTTAVIGSVGAFPFVSVDSKDAALYSTSISSGTTNTARVSSNGGATGTVLAEIYDATDVSTITATTLRLVNASVRHRISSSGMLTAGFVLVGETPRTILVRAIGPALAQYGVTDALPDPMLQLFRQGTTPALDANDDWGGGSTLGNAFSAVSAFPLQPASSDAAIVMRLEPGSYTAQVTSATSAAGTVLVEIYELP